MEDASMRQKLEQLELLTQAMQVELAAAELEQKKCAMALTKVIQKARQGSLEEQLRCASLVVDMVMPQLTASIRTHRLSVQSIVEQLEAEAG